MRRRNCSGRIIALAEILATLNERIESNSEVAALLLGVSYRQLRSFGLASIENVIVLVPRFAIQTYFLLPLVGVRCDVEYGS